MAISTHIAKTLESVSCLQKIDQLPIDLEHNLFAHYPTMKLGIDEDVAFYASELAKVAKDLVKETEDCYDWVVTAPPYNVIPAAANLISWKVYDLLKQSLSSHYQLSVINLRFPKKSLAINNAQEFKTYFEYSNNGIQERIKERAKIHQDSDDIVNHKEDFGGCGVIVINDIKVTGTQQQFMQNSFAKVDPAYLHWLYVFEVDEDLGKSDPQIEHRINHSKLQTLDEFSELICTDAIAYTARCFSRLFSHELDEFEFLVQQLSVDKQDHILELASREGRFEGEFFADKMGLLQALCAGDR